MDFIERWTPAVERTRRDVLRSHDGDGVRTVRARRASTSRSSRPGLAAASTRRTSCIRSPRGHVDRHRPHGVSRATRSRQIAREKAGIFKPGVPAVIGERDAGRRARCSPTCARERGARADVSCRRRDASPQRRRGRRRRARHSHSTAHGERGDGPHAARRRAIRRRTASLALLMLRRRRTRRYATTLDEARRWRCRGVRLPGRFHRVGHFIFDVAHNPDGARACSPRRWRPSGRPRPVAALLMRARATRTGVAMIGRAGAASSTRSCSPTRPTAPASRALATR